MLSAFRRNPCPPCVGFRTGLILDVAGIFQLEISGLFDRVIEHYGDEEKYPYGPPSHITRKIIESPDTPIRSTVRRVLFFEHKTGFYLIAIGFVLQLAGVWLWQTPSVH